MRAVPYRAQWESPDLVADILSGALRASDDPLWARSEADSVDEYEFWSWRACGMACLKMALAYWGHEEPPLVQLAEEASAHGAYLRHETGVNGMIYAPFASYVEQRFGLTALSCPKLRCQGLLRRPRPGRSCWPRCTTACVGRTRRHLTAVGTSCW